jgi:ATP-dependent helicase/nuclease subunit B
MTESFLGASHPKPGHLHVVPMDSAGFAGRRHLYVVGLDAQTSAPGGGEDAVLPDRERDEIDADGRMDRGSDAAGAQAWDFARALARVPPDGSVTLCARAHDPANGDTLFPGGLLLRAVDLAGLPLGDVVDGRGTVAGLVPSVGSGDIALRDVEADMALRGRPEGRATLAARFPVATRGVLADEERRSPRWTRYDGWLGPGRGLDPLAAGAVVSPSRLEDLATCPYRYLIKHVMKVRRPPETLDESQLLNHAERGTLLHSVFEQFSRGLRERGERPSREHEEEVVALTERLVDEALQQRGEPPEPAREALRRAMVDVARLYLYDEVRHAHATEPVAFEHGFGFDTPVPLALADDVVVPLRGFVDRVDRHEDGTYEIADFKTGGSYGFADPGEHISKLMGGGKKLQWALYAYAVRQTEGWNVKRAGYRFISAREIAERRTYPLPPERVVANILREVVAPARGGFFPQAPDPAGACRFCDVRRACGDVRRRKEEVEAAAASVAFDMNAEPVLRNWSRRVAR